MGRLRELLDELRAKKDADQRAVDDRAHAEWRNEGGHGDAAVDVAEILRAADETDHRLGAVDGGDPR